MFHALGVKKRILLIKDLISANIRSAMEYRINFFTEISVVFIVDMGLLWLWYIFFKEIPSLRGWQFNDTAHLLAVSWAGFALVDSFARNISFLSNVIIEGGLDYYLLSPQPLLLHLTFGKTAIKEVGSFFSAVTIFIILGNVAFPHICLYLLLVLLSALTYYSCLLLVGSLTLFIGHIERVGLIYEFMLLNLIFYPQTVFSGGLKVLMYTVLPIFFIGTVPSHILQSFSWYYLGMLVGFSVGLLLLARFTFYRGIRRYESGNLLAVRL
jgi:ABC-2 type transport system permease protein